MEQERLSNLIPNPKNPRSISRRTLDTLKASMAEFGELSGIISNAASSNLIGGHQRIKIFQELGVDAIHITWEATETPGPLGDLAYGYVEAPNGARFSYRRVMWDEARELAAMVAANNVHGDMVDEMLAEIDYNLIELNNGSELLALTGQDDKDLERLMNKFGPEPFGEQQPDEMGIDPKESSKREIRATVAQWEIIYEALEHIKSHRDIPAEDQGSKDGSALYYLARDFLDHLHGLTQDPQPSENPTSQNTGELTEIPDLI